MRGDGSPPSSWYDPPEPRHSDRTIIKDECNCNECHDWHVQEGMVEDNAGGPDFNSGPFECCQDQMEEWFRTGERCRIHPTAYVEPPTKTEPMHCEGCDPAWFKEPTDAHRV
jgi:hypothetical protein